MEELFKKVTISLSANVKEGRYVVKYYEWPIKRDTGKTIIVRKHHGDHKFLKNEILKAKPVRRNEKLNELGFSTVCHKKDLDDAIKLLEKTITTKLKELAVLQINTIAAWEGGCNIEKIN
jgi:hypothetical protein